MTRDRRGWGDWGMNNGGGETRLASKGMCTVACLYCMAMGHFDFCLSILRSVKSLSPGAFYDPRYERFL